MATGNVGPPVKPSKSIRTGWDKKIVKSSKLTVSTQERTIAPQSDWSAYMQMQAHGSAMHNPIPFPTLNFFSSATPLPYVRGNEHPSEESCATPPQYHFLCHRGDFHNSPILIPGMALTIPEAKGKISYGKDWNSSRKCMESSKHVGFVSGSSGESGKTAWSFGTEGASQRGSVDSSHKIEGKASQEELPAMKKRRFSQMLANEGNAHNKNIAPCDGAKCQVLGPGDLSLSMPASNWDTGSSSKGSSPASGVSEPVASAKMVANKEVMSEQQLQKEKRKQSNRESAMRSRIRRKKEREELEAKAEALLKETSMLTEKTQNHSENCMKLQEENNFLLEELGQIYGPGVVAMLEKKYPDLVAGLLTIENNSSPDEECRSQLDG